MTKYFFQEVTIVKYRDSPVYHAKLVESELKRKEYYERLRKGEKDTYVFNGSLERKLKESGLWSYLKTHTLKDEVIVLCRIM